MATLPTDATDAPNYDSDAHATHHNTLAGLWNKLTTKGDLLTATGAQAYARRAVGSNGQVLTADSGETDGMKWATLSGTTELLAVVRYEAGSGAALSTTTSATYADMDATNAAITFTAPASGKVLIRASGLAYRSSTGTWTQYGVNLREASSDLAGTDQIVRSSAIEEQTRYEFVAYLTGVSAGSHTYKLGHARISGTATLLGTYTGPTEGPLIIEAWAAP